RLHVRLLSSNRLYHIFSSMLSPPPISTLFPYTTLFRSHGDFLGVDLRWCNDSGDDDGLLRARLIDQIDGGLLWKGNGADILLGRSEEHTSELQSRFDLVCRLLLEKKNTARLIHFHPVTS